MYSHYLFNKPSSKKPSATPAAPEYSPAEENKPIDNDTNLKNKLRENNSLLEQFNHDVTRLKSKITTIERKDIKALFNLALEVFNLFHKTYINLIEKSTDAIPLKNKAIIALFLIKKIKTITELITDILKRKEFSQPDVAKKLYNYFMSCQQIISHDNIDDKTKNLGAQAALSLKLKIIRRTKEIQKELGKENYPEEIDKNSPKVDPDEIIAGEFKTLREKIGKTRKQQFESESKLIPLRDTLSAISIIQEKLKDQDNKIIDAAYLITKQVIEKKSSPFALALNEQKLEFCRIFRSAEEHLATMPSKNVNLIAAMSDLTTNTIDQIPGSIDRDIFDLWFDAYELMVFATKYTQLQDDSVANLIKEAPGFIYDISRLINDLNTIGVLNRAYPESEDKPSPQLGDVRAKIKAEGISDNEKGLIKVASHLYNIITAAIIFLKEDKIGEKFKQLKNRVIEEALSKLATRGTIPLAKLAEASDLITGAIASIPTILTPSSSQEQAVTSATSLLENPQIKSFMKCLGVLEQELKPISQSIQQQKATEDAARNAAKREAEAREAAENAARKKAEEAKAATEAAKKPHEKKPGQAVAAQAQGLFALQQPRSVSAPPQQNPKNESTSWSDFRVLQ